MIRSVGRHVQYTPETIDNLYTDNVDHHGLVYWYEDGINMNKEIKKSGEKKP